MSLRDPHSDPCDRLDDAGAYVLRALPDDEIRAFALHLEECADCRHDVEELQVVVDQLPMAAPQVVPPPELRGRIMAVVESEAALLRASGPAADVPVAPTRVPVRDRFRWTRIFLTPGVAVGLASVFVLLGVGAGTMLSSEEGPAPVRSVSASTVPPGAEVALEVQGDVGTLVIRDLPAPREGHVYQVWVRRGEAPMPTHTLFNVRTDGNARVEIDESLGGVDEVLVTEEPSGGSIFPSGPPVVAASVSS